jgi:SPP1 family predicted phage head-tail adaptor
MVRRSGQAQAGMRRTRLMLETPVETPNTLGGAAISFSPVIGVWGRLEALSGREREAGLKLEGVADTRITIRWRAGIDTRMRFSSGTRIFVIRSAFDPDDARRDLVCLCEEISP